MVGKDKRRGKPGAKRHVAIFQNGADENGLLSVAGAAAPGGPAGQQRPFTGARPAGGALPRCCEGDYQLECIHGLQDLKGREGCVGKLGRELFLITRVGWGTRFAESNKALDMRELEQGNFTRFPADQTIGLGGANVERPLSLYQKLIEQLANLIFGVPLHDNQ